MKNIIAFLFILLMITGCSSSKIRVYEPGEVASAIVVDNVYTFNKAIKNGFDIDYHFLNGDSLLSLALKENSLKVLSSLLKNGVNINSNITGQKVIGTNIILPSKAPIFFVNSEEALKLLIDNGANINEVSGDGELLLNYYIKTKPINLSIKLIESNAELNIKDMSEWYPIFWAVNIESEEILKSMIQKDKNIYLQKDKKLNYPIYYANSRNTMKYLLQFDYNINTKNIYGENILGEVLLKARKLGYDDVVNILIEKGVNPNYTSYK